MQRIFDFRGWAPEEIQSIDAPTLVMIGDHDIVRPGHAVIMSRLLPNLQLAILPGTLWAKNVGRSSGWGATLR